MTVEGNEAVVGTTKIRRAGGEPLIRPGITGLVEQLRRPVGIRDTSLNTNDTMIAAKSLGLKQASLDRINISIDTLDRESMQNRGRQTATLSFSSAPPPGNLGANPGTFVLYIVVLIYCA